jgi:hypothetical protein
VVREPTPSGRAGAARVARPEVGAAGVGVVEPPRAVRGPVVAAPLRVPVLTGTDLWRELPSDIISRPRAVSPSRMFVAALRTALVNRAVPCVRAEAGVGGVRDGAIEVRGSGPPERAAAGVGGGAEGDISVRGVALEPPEGAAGAGRARGAGLLAGALGVREPPLEAGRSSARLVEYDRPFQSKVPPAPCSRRARANLSRKDSVMSASLNGGNAKHYRRNETQSRGRGPTARRQKEALTPRRAREGLTKSPVPRQRDIEWLARRAWGVERAPASDLRGFSDACQVRNWL